MRLLKLIFNSINRLLCLMCFYIIDHLKLNHTSIKFTFSKSLFHKYSFLIIIIIGLSNNLSAQDTMVFDDGSIQVGIIIERNDSLLTYKKFYNQEGPIYIVRMSHIHTIAYVNGQIFSQKKVLSHSDNLQKKINYSEYLKRHYIAIITTDLLFRSFSINYMYLFKSARIGLRAPLSLGIGNIKNSELKYPSYEKNISYNNKDKIFSTGIDIIGFPFKRTAKFTFYVGPSFEYGQFNYLTYNDQYSYLKRIGYYKAAILQYGYMYNRSKHLHLILHSGIGYSASTRKYYYTGGYGYRAKTGWALRFNIQIGYKFN